MAETVRYRVDEQVAAVTLDRPEKRNSTAEGMAAARRAQRLTFASADHAEARAAFAERRPPRFTGR